MVGEIFTTFFIEKFKILLVGILIYVIIFSLLVITKPFGPHGKINSLVALISAIIVSFSGVVTYAITYAINWFIIIFFMIFLIMILLMFLGVKPTDISKAVSGKTGMYIAIAFGILFFGIIVKSFFALNNTFDTNNIQNDSYKINTQFNTGFTNTSEINNNNNKNSISFIDRLNSNKDLVYLVLFLIGIGIFIIFIGR